MEVVKLVVLMAHTPGVTSIVAVAGVAVASVIIKKKFERNGMTIAASLTDAIAYVAGGSIFLEFFLRAGHMVASMFGL